MFGHLHLHTMYSTLDGTGKIDEIFQRAKELGIPLQLWHLQNKIWRILETKSATPSRIVLALANELNFAVPSPN